MATRNLTRIFAELRERNRSSAFEARPSFKSLTSPRRTSEGHQKLLSDIDLEDPASPEQGLPPVWVDIKDNVNENVNLIEAHLRTLRKLYMERLKVSFDDDDQARDHKIELLTQEIGSVFRVCEKGVKRIAVVGNTSGDLPYSERVVRLNVMKAMAKKVQELSKKFRIMQKDFLIRLRAHEETGKEFFTQESSPRRVIDEELSEQQLFDLESATQSLDTREREIAKIAQSINDLAVIFKELSVLVVEQGSVLDRIDYNVEQTMVQVKAGRKELEIAEDYQKKGRTWCCIFSLLFGILVCVLILVYRDRK